MAFLADMVSGLVAAGAMGSLALDHGIFRRISERMDHSIYRGPAETRTIALTFDDGPGPQTLELLKLLREHSIPATFFQCGKQVERFPEITRQAVAEGHEIGNHTWNHPRLSPHLNRQWSFPTLGRMHRELADTQRLLTSVAGTAPTLFRAPYGARWIGLDMVRARLGMLGIQWTVIGHDWEWTAERIAPYVLQRAVPGAIVCLHDGRDTQPVADISETITALRAIIPALRAQGYNFATVSEMLRGGARGPHLQVS